MDGIGVEPRPVEEEEEEQHRAFRTILRVMASICAITAAILMMANKESTLVDGINLDIKYNYSSTFQFFAWVNIIAAVYTIISCFILRHLICEGPKSALENFTLFYFDLMVTLSLGAGLVAGVTFLRMAQNGNSRLGWLGICDHFKGFCLRSNVSLCFAMDGIGVEPQPVDLEQELIISNILRFIAFISSITAAILVMTNKESTVVDGVNLEIKYNCSSTLQFFAWANLIAAIYTVISWLILCRLNRKGPQSPLENFMLFYFDLMMSLTLGAGLVAVVTFYGMAQDGNSRLGWLGICDHYIGFCNRLNLSLGVGSGAFLFYLFSTLLLFPIRNGNNRINPI